MSRTKLRQITWWVIAADFPLLYLSANTPDATPTTVAALAVMAVAAAVAAVVY